MPLSKLLLRRPEHVVVVVEEHAPADRLHRVLREPETEPEAGDGDLSAPVLVLGQERPFVRAGALERRLRRVAIEADQRLAFERRLRAVRLARDEAEILFRRESYGEGGGLVDPELAPALLVARQDLGRLAGRRPHFVARRAEAEVADAGAGTDGEQIGHRVTTGP